MGLLVFVRNLLLALCLFLVLGFLYYSAWKLHLLQWEDSKYDRLGFLLKLDSKLPAELATKYANFSEGACKPGYASALMTAIFPRFSKPAPMFLDDSFRKWARIREFVPPFGIKGQDNLIKAILSVTKEYHLTPALDSLRCRRCIIVGNGGVLANKSLGSRIDDYDIVVRLNSAPVKGFEKDVGSKTTLRITYPEGAMQRPEQYERDSLFVLAGFKWQDFKWLKYIVYKERVSTKVSQGRVPAVHRREKGKNKREEKASSSWRTQRAGRLRSSQPRQVKVLQQKYTVRRCSVPSCHAQGSKTSLVVHQMASGNLWPLECPRSPLRSASSTRISFRKPPSPSSDCLSTTA
ncbi:CMP-N-acetylneuraminate-beta-1,4-galactoside alpha-2,3-sialyltransferase isoform X7 [Fukomys damarensis]|uniref:CMP-N-acetylneuraminate-beta-1,4-galactoside alpha-2,3-sialyltransferase isoform X7 n=1 Tax=Fukomys damarensis TaxID=885580 RepID=UPI001455160A|nr:CMP-N-acetylneuraminate-beta-1,4-galactoside alpha-2,3-sialyltransferase isoform X7 [Fukomys damarensis]